MPAAPETFRSRVREVWDVLAYTFDFDIFERPLAPENYATPAPWLPAFVVPGAAVSVIGRDGTGGVYIHCRLSGAARAESKRQSCILHIDTRGNAVCIGDTLEQAVALIVALPYWPELLAQLPRAARCPSGELPALRELAVQLEREARDDLPALPAARQDLQSFLQLPVLADPVSRLHQLAVQQPPPVTVWSPHGWQYESPARAAEQRAP